MLRVTFRDGKIKKYSETHHVSTALFGASAITEHDFMLGDLTQGLYMRITVHRPHDDEYVEGSGARCYAEHVALVCLLGTDELKDVVEIKEDGNVVALRMLGELVTLARVSALAQVYLSSSAEASLTDVVCELYPLLEEEYAKEHSGSSDPDTESSDTTEYDTKDCMSWAAEELGLPLAVLSHVLELAEDKTAQKELLIESMEALEAQHETLEAIMAKLDKRLKGV